MTCIIGFTDPKTDVSYIGGDSLGSNGYTKSVQTASKVFRNKTNPHVVIGGTSTFRHLDLLKYSEKLFDEVDVLKGTKIDHEFMVTKFIPNVITLFKDNIPSLAETDRGGNFIVAIRGKIFEIQNDYSVLEPQLGFCAVGCGEEVAMGSMLTTYAYDWKPEDKIIKALECAEQYCCGVQRPFKILSTDGFSDVIE